MAREVPKNLSLSEWGDEGYVFTLWQRVADFCAKFFQTPNGKVEAYIDSLLRYSSWMASCHIGKTSADKDWQDFSLWRMPREAKDVLKMTRHRVHEVLEGFLGDVHGAFSAEGSSEERPSPPDNFDTFFSDFFREGMDEIVDVLLEAVRQIALKEIQIKDRIKISNEDELEDDSRFLGELMGGAKKRLEFTLLKGAYHVGQELIDLDKAMGRDSNLPEFEVDVVSNFCYWAPAQVRFNPRYDVFFESFLNNFVKDRVFVEFILSTDELVFSDEQRRMPWYLQFENSMSELHQLFVSIERKETVLPEEDLYNRVEGVLRKVFQALETCKFLSSADELGRQIGLRLVEDVDDPDKVPGVFVSEAERGEEDK